MNSKILDALRILGLQPGASPAEVKAAYRKLAKEYHPDKVASLGEELRDLASKKMKEINAAYKRLETSYDGEAQPHAQPQEEAETHASGSSTKDGARGEGENANFEGLDVVEEKTIDDPSQIEKLRAKVSVWASLIPHHDLTDLGSRMEQISAVLRPAYYISLHSQYESRTLCQGQEPSTHVKTPDLLKNSQINVWRLPFGSFTRFEDHTENYKIEDSEVQYGCPQCGGRLYLTCRACGGLRTQPCETCGGHGKLRCDKCDGGYKKCWQCSGRGQVEKQLSSSYGYQRVVENCPHCAGRGHTLCNACVHGFKTCDFCSGAGKITCADCGGEGQVVCDGCRGRGTITSYLYARQKFYLQASAQKILHPAACEAFRKDFLAGFEKKLIKDAKQLFESLRPEWSANDFGGLRNERLKKAAIVLVSSAKGREEQRSPFKGSHIVQQKLRIFREEVTCVDYRCYEKSYRLYVYGKSGAVWADHSPIHDVEKSRITKAEMLFKEKKYSEAADLVRKAIAMAPANKGHKEFLKRILKAVRTQYLWGGAIGGTVILPLVGTFTGLGIGNILSNSLKDKVRTGKKRFFLSFLVAVICNLLIAALIACGVWLYLMNLALNESHMRLQNYSTRKAEIESFGPVSSQMQPEYEWLKRKLIEESEAYETRYRKISWLGIPRSSYAGSTSLQTNGLLDPEITSQNIRVK